MAHFRGTIHGQRGRASRLGSTKSGLSAHIASWQGAVNVHLSHDAVTGVDYVEVALTSHYGQGVSKTLYFGPVQGTLVP